MRQDTWPAIDLLIPKIQLKIVCIPVRDIYDSPCICKYVWQKNNNILTCNSTTPSTETLASRRCRREKQKAEELSIFTSRLRNPLRLRALLSLLRALYQQIQGVYTFYFKVMLPQGKMPFKNSHELRDLASKNS